MGYVPRFNPNSETTLLMLENAWYNNNSKLYLWIWPYDLFLQPRWKYHSWLLMQTCLELTQDDLLIPDIDVWSQSTVDAFSLYWCQLHLLNPRILTYPLLLYFFFLMRPCPHLFNLCLQPLLFLGYSFTHRFLLPTSF